MISKIKLYYSVLGLRGLLSFVRAKVTKSIIYFNVSRPDCKYPLELRIPSSDVSIYRQMFIWQEYDFQVTTEPKVIVDAGANIGFASVYFANKFPNARIIAIEPELSNFELLKKNTARYANVIAVQAALWNKNEDINLIDPGFGEWGFMTEDQRGSNDNHKTKARHIVEAMTVDKIIEDYELSKIDILKIDIEGAELEVFGDTSLWLDKVDSIIVELHEHFKAGCTSSFYKGAKGFDYEWRQGENVYLSRDGCLTRSAA